MEPYYMLTVRYTAKPGKRKEFYDKITENNIAVLSQAEEGNVQYAYFIPPDAPDDLCLFEIWTSVAAQRMHRETAWFARLSQLKTDYVAKTQIKSYFVLDKEPS